MALTLGDELEIRQGTHAWLDFDAVTDGAVQDISGWTITLVLKWGFDDDDADAALTLAGAVLDGPTGSGTVPITPADTVDLPVRTRFAAIVIGTDTVGQDHPLDLRVIHLLPGKSEA